MDDNNGIDDTSDDYVLGRLNPAPGRAAFELDYPGPVIRDKTDEYDMRPKKKIVPDHNGVSDARIPGDAPDDFLISGVVTALTETLGQGADGGGQRLNAGKNRIELLPPEWIWALADVMTQGSEKYEARNWEKGMDWSAMIGCMQRHLAKFQRGQRFDGKELDIVLGTTGCHELAMVAWNALALMSYDIRNIGNNNIPVIEQLDLFNDVNAMTSNLEQRWTGDRITPSQ